MKLIDCFEHPDLASKFLFESLHLIDITQMADDEIHRHKKVALLEIVQKNIWMQDMINFADRVALALKEDMHRIETELFKDMLEYILVNKDSEHFHEFVQLLSAHSSLYGETIMNIAERLKLDGLEKGMQQGIQQGMQQGMQKGMQQGMQQGMQKEKQSIVEKMITENFPLEMIEKITGLTEEEIKKIAH